MFCSFVQIRSLLGAVLGPALVIGLLSTTGCWNEVSYDAPSSKGPSNEALSEAEEEPAPGEETVEEPTEELTDEPAIEAPSLSAPGDAEESDEPGEIVTPVESDRYTTSEAPAEEAPEGLLPWETASSADDTSPEAERLFGGADEPQGEAEAPKVVEEVEVKEEEPDGFESFLTEAYAGLVDAPTDTPEAEVEEPEVEKSAEELPREIVVEEIAGLPLPETVALPPTEPAEEELPDAELPPQEYSEEDSEEESFESLFADSDSEETEPTGPAVDPVPPRYAEEPLPLPPKEPVMPEPAEASGPRIEPLPAVSVLPNNTRHLAWLLGGKLSLAQLAGAGGATSDEVALWTEETQRLAEQLKVTTPPGVDAQASGAERVGRLLSSAAEIGNTLAGMYGPDHAALVEMALKTNALLVLHQERPELTPAVARAVAAAANRADLPGYVWRDSIKVLERRPTVDEVYDAVVQLHADVEAHLR